MTIGAQTLFKGLTPPEIVMGSGMLFVDRFMKIFERIVSFIRTLPWLASMLIVIVDFFIVAMPYIVIACVIVFISTALGMTQSSTRSSNSRSSGGSSESGSGIEIDGINGITGTGESNWIERTGAPSSFAESYSIDNLIQADFKMAIYNLNPFAGVFQSIARPIFRNGRCDNMNYLQFSSAGINWGGLDKKCIVLKKPKDIEWSIDESKIPEFATLPAERKKELQHKLKIKIPFEPKESFYLPNCDKAKYEDGSPADMYIDAGLTCNLNTKSIINSGNTAQDKQRGYYVDR